MSVYVKKPLKGHNGGRSASYVIGRGRKDFEKGRGAQRYFYLGVEDTNEKERGRKQTRHKEKTRRDSHQPKLVDDSTPGDIKVARYLYFRRRHFRRRVDTAPPVDTQGGGRRRYLAQASTRVEFLCGRGRLGRRF